MKRLFWLPPLVVVAYGAARVWAPDESSAIWVHRLAPAFAELLAAAGCVAAALAFSRGDYLRRAWALAALGYVCLSGGALQSGPIVGDLSWLRAGLTVVANVAGVASYVMFARTWVVAGMEAVDDRRRRKLALVAAVLIALALAGASLVLGVYAIATGVPAFGITVLFGALGDMVGLIILAPVAMNALALRGGRLARPWGLMTGALLSWLFFSAQALVAMIIGLEHDFAWMHAGAEVFRLMACSFMFLAAMAQRDIVTTED